MSAGAQAFFAYETRLSPLESAPLRAARRAAEARCHRPAHHARPARKLTSAARAAPRRGPAAERTGYAWRKVAAESEVSLWERRESCSLRARWRRAAPLRKARRRRRSRPAASGAWSPVRQAARRDLHHLRVRGREEALPHLRGGLRGLDRLRWCRRSTTLRRSGTRRCSRCLELWGKPGDRADSTATSGWRGVARHPRLCVMTTAVPRSRRVRRSICSARRRACGVRVPAFR